VQRLSRIEPGDYFTDRFFEAQQITRAADV
jgi:hypothetical protein